MVSGRFRGKHIGHVQGITECQLSRMSMLETWMVDAGTMVAPAGERFASIASDDGHQGAAADFLCV